jgi:hypothetical protein
MIILLLITQIELHLGDATISLSNEPIIYEYATQPRVISVIPDLIFNGGFE